MRILTAVLTTIAVLAGTSASPVGGALPRYVLAGDYLAGISSGGYMATQLHVAYSGTFRGVAIFAAGPYDCAQDSLPRALTACSDNTADDQLSALESTTADWARQGRVDPTGNLSGAPVYLFHGGSDTKVQKSVVDDLAAFYRHFGAAVNYDTSTPAGHAWISPKGPNPCTSTRSPYINNCGTDPQATFLRQFLGTVQPPNTGTPRGSVQQFDQGRYAPSGDATAVGLAGTGYLYSPATCANGASCRLLVALHGCLQNAAGIGTTFVADANLNGYADTNNLVVLYPQTTSSATNPQSCWDWWGYLGGGDTNYATHGGAQLETVMRMVHALGG